MHFSNLVSEAGGEALVSHIHISQHTHRVGGNFALTRYKSLGTAVCVKRALLAVSNTRSALAPNLIDTLVTGFYFLSFLHGLQFCVLQSDASPYLHKPFFQALRGIVFKSEVVAHPHHSPMCEFSF